MCESLWTTSEVTDDHEKMNNFFQQNELVETPWLLMHRRRLFYPLAEFRFYSSG